MARRIAGRYDLLEELGSGGMGTVYKALDTTTEDIVAVKQLHSHMADESLIERFKREGEALRDLNHPNIVKMLDECEDDGIHYLVMEYVPGSDLDNLLEHGQLSLEQILNIAIDLADALTRAHRLNIIHRDLKPANILIRDDGTLRLTDFGVAHIGSKQRVTDTDAIVGTIDYLPPEAFGDKPYDERGDIWAFGVILFEMLAGEKPFGGETILQCIQSISSDPLPDLEELRPDCPVTLVDLVYQMLDRNIDARVHSVRQIGLTLEDLLQGRDSAPRERFVDITDSAINNLQLEHNLPPQVTSFVGREAEMAELTKLVSDPSKRLVTVLAPGGMGKTRLTVEVASRFVATDVTSSTLDALIFSDGVYFVDLAPLISEEQIVPQIGTALSFVFQQEARSHKQQLLDYLSNKRMLLLFDNFEHILDSTSIVSEIMAQAPSIQIIATSRQRLGLRGETIFHLSGMDFPDWETPEDAMTYAAIQLFTNSAQRADPQWELTSDNLDYVARICRLVQGMPLGILLSAAWVAMLSEEEIADELQQGIDILADEIGEFPGRQQSIRTVMEYSWQIMSDKEQSVFMMLSVCKGGCTREAAQAIAGAKLQTLMGLVNKSLLARNRDSGRYSIHELLRQYAEEKLIESKQLAEAQLAHATYYSQFLSDQVPGLKGAGQGETFDKINRDFENCYAAWMNAVEQEQEATINQMIEGLYLYLKLYRRHNIGYSLFEAARQQWFAIDSTSPLIAGRLNLRFTGIYDHSDRETAELSLAIAEHHGDPAEIAFCKGELGRKYGHAFPHNETDMRLGISLMEEALVFYENTGDRFYQSYTLDDLAWTHEMLTDVQKRFEMVPRVLQLKRETGDLVGYAETLSGYLTRIASHDPEEAQRLLDESEALAIRYNNPMLLVRVQLSRALFYQSETSDYEQAYKLYQHCLTRSQQLKYEYARILAQLGMGWILCVTGDLDKAKTLIDEALPSDEFMLTNFEYIVQGTMVKMNYYTSTGQFKKIIPYFATIFKDIRPVGANTLMIPAILQASILARLQGDYRRAGLLWGLSHTSHLAEKYWSETLRQWNAVIEHEAFLKRELGKATLDTLIEESKSLDIIEELTKLAQEFEPLF